MISFKNYINEESEPDINTWKDLLKPNVIKWLFDAPHTRTSVVQWVERVDASKKDLDYNKWKERFLGSVGGDIITSSGSLIPEMDKTEPIHLERRKQRKILNKIPDKIAIDLARNILKMWIKKFVKDKETFQKTYPNLEGI
jgi:hypothetical protein